MTPCFSQDSEFAAVEAMALTLAKRTQTHFVVDDHKRESFLAFSNTIAAFSCEGSLGVWSSLSSNSHDAASTLSTPATRAP